MTIDDLMSQYFESVETDYPSIVANVVRTSGRLNAPPLTSQSTSCSICELLMTRESQGLYGWGGDQAKVDFKSPAASSEGASLCYGCARSTLSSSVKTAERQL